LKTHRNLWTQFISAENFDLAVRRALKNKKKTREIRDFIADRENLTECLRRLVERGEFRTSAYRERTIYEPKMREISILPFWPDRIVHHAVMNVLIPIWDASFCSDSYACRTGFGLHPASRRTMQFVRRNKYFLQCDIRKFYPTMDHGVLMRGILHKIRDRKLLAIIEDIIDSTPSPGIPIGNFCSQWFGNLYLDELDRFVKQDLGVADYVRYCDDFILFSDDKKLLGRFRERIREFLSRRLCQRFSFAEIAPVSAGVDFLGYRHFPRAVLLRKSTIARLRRRLKTIARAPDKTTMRIVGQLAAMRGWAMHARRAACGRPFND
jgi:retron-type reverse transcriptase